MHFFYLMNRPILAWNERIRNYFLYISYRFLAISICITLIELNCFWKSFRCFSDWRHTDFRHSRNFSLSTLASVVFHVRKWTALTATKLHHLKKCKMRVAARTDPPIREGCLQSSNNVHIGMSAYYAESTLNIWYKQIANGLLWTWDQEGRIE